MIELWNQVQKRIETAVGHLEYQVWLQPCTVSNGAKDTITLHAPNRFYVEWIRDNLLATIDQELRSFTGRPITVRLEAVDSSGTAEAAGSTAGADPEPRPRGAAPLHVDDPPARVPAALERHGEAAIPFGEPPAEAPAPSVEAKPATAPAPAEPVSDDLLPDKTFDTFVVASFNEFAATCAQAVAERPAEPNQNPLFIFGGTGLGKTHLMHAIGNAFVERWPDRRIRYVTAENWTNEFIDCIRTGSTKDFRRRYREETGLLLMDDVQFLSGKESTQEELFHTFEALMKRGSQIVFTADVQPREIKGLEPRLSTRCESGIVAEVQPPNAETLLAIFGRKIQDLDIEVDPELARYICARIRGNVRELEGALNRLQALCRVHRRQRATLDFVRTYAGDMIYEEPRKPKPEHIIRTVAQFYGVAIHDIKGKRRNKHLVTPRHVAMFLVREACGTSFPEIGRIFDRDHATVQHACKKIRKLKRSDPDLRAVIDKLSSEFGY